MPSHSDRVRRHYQEPVAQAAAVERDEAVARPLSDLGRFAGWLNKDHASVVVRASVQALDDALTARGDTLQLLQTLDEGIERLPSGDIRRMLRKAAGQTRAAIELRSEPAGAGEIS